MFEIDVKTGKSSLLTDVLVAFSAANLALFGIWSQLIYVEGNNVYYLTSYTWHSYFASIILLLVLAVVFLFALKKLCTPCASPIKLISIAVLAAYVPLIANAVRLTFNLPIAWIIKELSSPFIAIAVLIASVLVIGLMWLLRKQLTALIYIVLLVLFPIAPLNVIHVSYEGVSRAVEEESVANEKVYNYSTREKTILLIFDELDYRMAFEEKVPGLKLKNLHYLKQNSLFFTNAISLFSATYSAIPSLTIGHSVSPFFIGEDDLGVKLNDSDVKSTWRKTETLFSKLVGAGKNVALMGYYHPYCRIFGDMVDYCKAYSSSRGVETARSNSVYQSFIKQAISLTPFYRVLNAIGTYKGLEEATMKKITHDAMDFIYVHFNLPHSPYYYDREAEKLTIFNVVDGYIDNLQLTDIVLGRIINRLKEENLWDTSTLIVTSDHHWRHVDEYDGVVSRKIPLIVKLPEQNKMLVSDTEISLLQLKPMIEKIMLDKILDPVDLAEEFENTGG